MSPGSPLQPSLRTLVTIRITTAPKRALHPGRFVVVDVLSIVLSGK